MHTTIDLQRHPGPDSEARAPRSTGWLFTLFEVPVPASEIWAGVDTAAGGVRHCTWQLERCPDTGREHIQLYVEYTSRQRRSRLSAILGFGRTAHGDPRRGSPEQAAAYCSKEETRVAGPWTVGEDVRSLPSRQGRGKRTDLDEVVQALQEGKSSGDVALAHPKAFVLHHRGIEALEYRLAPAALALDSTLVFVLSGAPRVGKTGAFWDIFGTSMFDLPLPGERSSDLLRWEGFDARNHTAVLIDEFAGQVDINTLKRICDKWPFSARMFGRPSLRIRPRYICITSQSSPDQWWPLRWHSLDGTAMRARITYYKWCDTYAHVAEATSAIRGRLAPPGTGGQAQEGSAGTTVPECQLFQPTWLEGTNASRHSLRTSGE